MIRGLVTDVTTYKICLGSHTFFGNDSFVGMARKGRGYYDGYRIWIAVDQLYIAGVFLRSLFAVP